MTSPADSLPILYQDEYLVAVHKPSGLAVHRDQFSPRGMVVCLQLLRDQIGREVHPVHRLDGATSGLILFAYDREIIAALSLQFMNRSVQKTYHAVTRGWMKPEVHCDLSMKKDLVEQEAATSFRTIAHLEMPWGNEKFPMSRYSFVEVKPETGRFHQIRRHANYLAHPLVGDTKHGDSTHNRLWREHRQCHRLLLHASSLEFEHPISKQPFKIECAMPDDFKRHLDEMPWQVKQRAEKNSIF